ncbi:hypothetical protein Ccur_12950 [Cryptobacterium curtum DSM 15641]|uniref:Uncharacterized protein n=1 Tax=Cryptobacterium curtum (strain ATCC 700683 / DSM 15641 / CCUG 43107 / 12-3) TaxID=469378 RepID=C7ML26_CRYCD|nr:hypothetical protein [Cryptobacterium curtum]ACU94973.1 hypothetical protein Ccur_12950 [Cryptobacterium curtum DSM 15641]
MGWAKIGLFAGGMVASAVIQAASKSATVRKGVVKGVASAMAANDSLQTATQSIIDDAQDLRAEADRKRRIEAAVRQRMDEVEQEAREEATAQIDGKTTSKKGK